MVEVSKSCAHVAGDLVESIRLERDGEPALVVRLLTSRSPSTDSVDPLWMEMVGDLDVDTAGRVAAKMRRVDAGVDVVIDLCGVSFIDSAGLRCLEAFGDDVIARGGRVRFHDPSSVVRRLVATLDIDRFVVCESVAPQHSLRHRPLRSDDVGSDGAQRVEVECGLSVDTIPATSAISPTERSVEAPSSRDDVVYILRGELDAAAVQSTSGSALPGVDRMGAVTVDLAGVTIVDSAGIRFLERWSADVAAAGGHLVLREPSSAVRRVLAALDVSFDIESRREGRPTRPAVPSTRRFRRSRQSRRRPSDVDSRNRAGLRVGWASTVELPAEMSGTVWSIAERGVPNAGGDGRRLRPIRIGGPGDRVRATPARSSVVDLDDAIRRVADAAVWKPLHGVTSPARHSWDQWNAYRAINEQLARSVDGSCAVGECVWINDYPFLLAPERIRSRRPDLRIGFSLHTSFDTNTMADHAHAAEIAAGLSACDLIGVQTLADVHQLDGFLAQFGCDGGPTIVVSPTSIDPDHTIASADRAATSPHLRDLRQRTGSRRLVMSVDDLERSSAIVERIVAFDLAFRRGVLSPDDVHIVQILDTRHRDPTHDQALGVEIERLAHTLNATWIRADRSPVIDTHVDSIPTDATLAMMRLADVFMFIPTRAGTGTRAKEFSVLAEATHGALILSDRCGAAAELGPHSVLVGDVRPDSIVDGLDRAARLDLDERSRHAVRRSAVVRRWTSADWTDDLLDQLAFPPITGGPATTGRLDEPARGALAHRASSPSSGVVPT